MIMPKPAIRPRLATPTKAVGVKARKPNAVAIAAIRICPPTRRAVASSAASMLDAPSESSRKRTVNWIAKSTAMPTNRIAKATEIRFSVPTAIEAKAVVSASPSTSVVATGRISRQETRARNSQSTTRQNEPIRPATAPLATEANSSSARATLPVIRTRATPDCTNGRVRAAARIASVAAPPGETAL